MRSPLTAAVVLTCLAGPVLAQPRPHNVILFVADGLRPGMVNEKTAPAMAGLLARGVRFTNTHSLFPTFTTANASGMATGHMLGDTGDSVSYTHLDVYKRQSPASIACLRATSAS